ncbi:Wzz/FepE/Etk N-terminal domain-containing protein [Pseudomonas sp.]|uniref:Wzz/FepE/Etk N-terminal domain-containing protein n=1 Tax=Pseudomonas sp. TaxID=306 RepID=UPI003267D813
MSSFRASSLYPSDEIDLVALFQAVRQEKKLIVQVTSGFVFLAVAYAFLATQEYQVSSVLRPAAINELDALNRSEVYKLPPGEALLKLGASLESYETRLGFFRANQPLFREFERPGRTLEQSFEEFNRNSIRLILPDPKKSDSLSAYIGLEMNYPKGVDGVTILNSFVEYAITNERKQIAADLNVIIKNRLNEISGKFNAARASYETNKEAKIASLLEADNVKRARLQDELKALRAQIKTTRVDRIAQLSEAIGIARSLGISKPATPSSLGDTTRKGSNSVMRTEINNQPIPLYFMGVEALEAERRALAQRGSDDFSESRIAQIAKELQMLQSNREVEMLKRRENEDIFLAGVEPLRAEMVRLRNLNIDMDNLKLVSIDRAALEPLSAYKPKKALIIGGGFILGLIFGTALAVFRSVLRKKKQAK